MRRLICILLLFTTKLSFGMAPKLDWDKAVDHAIQRYGLGMEPSLKAMFVRSKVAYPPQEVA